MRTISAAISSVLLGVLLACGQDGAQGPPGPPGAVGGDGRSGLDGANADGGASGTTGEVGPVGPPGPAGPPGTNATNPNTETSGARLKARYTTTTTTGTDGAKQTTKYFAGWFDSQRNEPCAGTAAADGKTRCLPSSAALPEFYYSDAGCTQAAVVLSNAAVACASVPISPVPKYVSDSVIVGACSGSRLRSMGPKLATTSYWIKFGAGACSGPNPVGATLDVYDATGAEIPASSFVELTVISQTL